MSGSQGATAQGTRGRAPADAASPGVAARVDRIVARLLRAQAAPPDKVSPTGEGWPLQTPVLVSAVRCILRYVFLPFALPLIGIASGAALSILLVLDVVAAIAIVTTLRRLWQTKNPSRWQYLALALVLAVLVSFFFVADAPVI